MKAFTIVTLSVCTLGAVILIGGTLYRMVEAHKAATAAAGLIKKP